MAIYRVTARWDGFTGAPGYSTFHFTADPGGDTAVEARQRVWNFLDGVSGATPGSTRITVSPELEVLDEASGALTGYALDNTDLGTITGGTSDQYPGPVGAVVHWNTETVAKGRRLRGRTFIVPLSAGNFDTEGTIRDDALAWIRDAAAEMVEGPFTNTFCVWSRPVAGSGGVVGPVTSSYVPDFSAVLRSRRD